MTDRPIIFSAPMIRALLDGRKTQTRRLAAGTTRPTYPGSDDLRWSPSPWRKVQPGYRLWVREAWAPYGMEALPEHERPIFYRADPDDKPGWMTPPDIRWRSSIHMPQWASRLTLTVTDVRVQRLQEITSADAIAEGIRPAANSMTIDCETPNPRDGFRDLWNRLHGPGAWEANPWIVALTFTVAQRNIDAQ